MRKHRLDLAEREAGLIPAELVRQRWAAIAVSVRNAVLAIPGRVAPDVAACQTPLEAREVLAAECEQVLRLLAAELAGGGAVAGNGSAAVAQKAAVAAGKDADNGTNTEDDAAPKRKHAKRPKRRRKSNVRSPDAAE